MANLKRLTPQMSKLVAQSVHQKYQAIMYRETAELRAVVLELLNRGYDPKRVFEGLLRGDAAMMTSKTDTSNPTNSKATKEGAHHGIS